MHFVKNSRVSVVVFRSGWCFPVHIAFRTGGLEVYDDFLALASFGARLIRVVHGTTHMLLLAMTAAVVRIARFMLLADHCISDISRPSMC
jgi:hypothetical protein